MVPSKLKKENIKNIYRTRSVTEQTGLIVYNWGLRGPGSFFAISGSHKQGIMTVIRTKLAVPAVVLVMLLCY